MNDVPTEWTARAATGLLAGNIDYTGASGSPARTAPGIALNGRVLVVVMGVAGSGKSTIGERLSERQYENASDSPPIGSKQAK